MNLRESFIRRLNLFRKAEILYLVTFRTVERLDLKKSQFQKSAFFPFFRGFSDHRKKTHFYENR